MLFAFIICVSVYWLLCIGVWVDSLVFLLWLSVMFAHCSFLDLFLLSHSHKYAFMYHRYPMFYGLGDFIDV
jgi:hypothetical protein